MTRPVACFTAVQNAWEQWEGAIRCIMTEDDVTD